MIKRRPTLTSILFQLQSALEVATVKENGVKAVREEFVNECTTKDSHVSVTLLDQDVLDCPICYEPLKIPIFQCDNGHLSCSLCCNKVNNICPSCTLPIGYNRCRAMEKVIESSRVSCPNAEYGCKENNISYGNQSSHEKTCIFAPFSCPFRRGGCDYAGSYNGLKNHLNVNKHNQDLKLFAYGTTIVIKFTLCDEIMVLKEEKDGDLIVMQCFNGGAVLTVSCIAPFALEPGKGRFYCTLELRSFPNKLRQRFAVKKIQKLSSEQPRDGFVLIPSYLLPTTGILYIKMLIRRDRECITNP